MVVTSRDSETGTLSGGYTYTTSNPAPAVSFHRAAVGNDGGRDTGDDYGNGISGGSERNSGRNRCDRCKRWQQYLDHGDDAGAHSGSGGCGGNEQRIVRRGTLSGYTYTTSNPAPAVTSIAPPSGTTAGGTPVTIMGTG